MSMLDLSAVPARVETYLRELFWQRVHPLLLTFDAGWHLRDIHGDAAHYGIDSADPAQGTQLLRDLFIGMPLDEPQDVPFVELDNGRSAHLHLIPDGESFHVLLLDAETERERRRVQQQLGHEEALKSQAKTKAIGQLKQIRTELERQHARLEEAHALKNALIATMSHEFRTPLTSIFGYLQLIDRRAKEEPTICDALHAVRRNATYLFTLAENLLEYGRSESSVALLNPTPIDLAALARDLEAMFRPLAEEKGLEFHVTLKLDDATEPVFDEVRLRQILLNLLSNAVRYTRRGEITADLVWRGQTFSADITDTGIGIAAAQLPSIFEMFGQVQSALDRSQGGLGIGLSLSKRLVEMHGGRISAHSAGIGHGCELVVRLPLAVSSSADAPAAARSVARPADGSARRIVVADDLRDSADTLAAVLRSRGHEVHVAYDGEAALRLAEELRPDVVLLDLGMPAPNGFDVCRRIRAEPWGGAMRVIAQTGWGQLEERQRTRDAGFDQHVVKPIDIAALDELIRSPDASV